MIKLADVRKIYGKGTTETIALDGVSFEIETGAMIAFMGASGSGKSTLLNIIGGMDVLTSGIYEYDGICVNELKVKELNEFRRKNVSFVFQNFALMDYFNVYENVELPLKMRGISGKRRQLLVNSVLKETGIADKARKLPAQLSGGQKQRCAIARALVADTPLVLADEPTGALDTETASEIMGLFHKLHDIGKTVIIVTHDPKVAAQCERIIHIEDGKINMACESNLCC